MTKKSGLGSMVATIIIIILILVGALYFWGKRVETRAQNQAAYNSAGTVNETAAAAQAVETQKVSGDDSLATVKSETQTTNTTNLSQGL